MKNRIFKNAGSHFYLWEELAETNILGEYECFGWTKTHIIVQKCAKLGAVGLQILRFESNSKQETLKLKANPYAGVYLFPDEWRQVISALTD